jgi:hypothetical protein
MFLSASSSLTISRRAMGILQRLSLQSMTSWRNNTPEMMTETLQTDDISRELMKGTLRMMMDIADMQTTQITVMLMEHW